MSSKDAKFIPALRFNILTPLYDFLINKFFRERQFKEELVRQADIDGRYRILDIGCGTATLTIMIKKAHLEAEVTGLDFDRKILEIAEAKIQKEMIQITLVRGSSFELPFPDGSFDRVFSSLMLHHLTTEHKYATSREVFRVLRPGGEFHVADFAKPHNKLMYGVSQFTKMFEEVADNIMGMLPGIFAAAGFEPVRKTADYSTLLGTVSLYKVVKP